MPTATRAVALYRVISAGTMWIVPEPVTKPFGLATPADQPGTYLGRLFASRDVALGVGVLQAEGDARRHWLKIGLAVDLVDLAGVFLARRSGALSPRGVVTGALGSGLAAALSAAALLEER